MERGMTSLGLTGFKTQNSSKFLTERRFVSCACLIFSKPKMPLSWKCVEVNVPSSAFS
uniref:Uncharacterized protein n=2 Tax=Anguilla anguilla TaxID=7936 RepID=A0A0E9SXU5_ANGAN